MKSNLKMTALAVAVAAMAMGMGTAQAQEDDDNVNYTKNVTINKNINKNYTSNHTDTLNHNENTNYNENVSINQSMDQQLTEKVNLEADLRVQDIQSDIRSERNEHGVSVQMDKSLRLKSDIEITGRPTVSGDIAIDSAAISIIDNRQSSSNNLGINQNVTNDASIADDVASSASGNLGFNVAAGDNNVQDNAAALASTDAAFAFGMADSEIFVNQAGSGNLVSNVGVTNNAGIGGNAFESASGNIAVNVTSGNNNLQKNALSASVATTNYATASVSSNQHSAGNMVENNGLAQKYTDTVEVSMSGSVSGYSVAVGQGEYAGRGNAYQQTNFYADSWEGEFHPAGPSIGHVDYDIDSQNAVANPYRDGVGGLAFDTDEEGDLGFVELGYSDLAASLTGTVTTTNWLIKDATNTASLSGSAFSSASGNIGVNVSAGTGNMQANSLAMAVGRPAASGGGTPPSGE